MLMNADMRYSDVPLIYHMWVGFVQGAVRLHYVTDCGRHFLFYFRYKNWTSKNSTELWFKEKQDNLAQIEYDIWKYVISCVMSNYLELISWTEEMLELVEESTSDILQ